MASGVNAHGSCKGAALEIPIQVRVQALSLAVVTFNTGVNRNMPQPESICSTNKTNENNISHTQNALET